MTSLLWPLLAIVGAWGAGATAATVAVTGATGRLGRHAVEQLVAAGGTAAKRWRNGWLKWFKRWSTMVNDGYCGWLKMLGY